MASKSLTKRKSRNGDGSEQQSDVKARKGRRTQKEREDEIEGLECAVREKREEVNTLRISRDLRKKEWDATVQKRGGGTSDTQDRDRAHYAYLKESKKCTAAEEGLRENKKKCDAAKADYERAQRDKASKAKKRVKISEVKGKTKREQQAYVDEEQIENDDDDDNAFNPIGQSDDENNDASSPQSVRTNIGPQTSHDTALQPFDQQDTSEPCGASLNSALKSWHDEAGRGLHTFLKRLHQTCTGTKQERSELETCLRGLFDKSKKVDECIANYLYSGVPQVRRVADGQKLECLFQELSLFFEHFNKIWQTCFRDTRCKVIAIFQKYYREAQCFVFGDGGLGQLGVEPLSPIFFSHGPMLLNIERKTITKVVCGPDHTMAIADGQVYTWGNALCAPVLGREIEDENQCSVPGVVNLGNSSSAVDLSTGEAHAVVVTANGEVWCWGLFEDDGADTTCQISFSGTDASECHHPPVMVFSDPQDPMRSVTSGSNHVLAVTEAGKLFSWGCGKNGRLGRLSEEEANNFTSGDHVNVMQVKALSGRKVLTAIAGDFHSIAILEENNEVHAWGSNLYGQIGLLDSGVKRHVFFPERVLQWDGKQFFAGDGGRSHTILLSKGGKAFLFGKKFDKYESTDVGEFVVAVAANDESWGAVTKSGRAYLSQGFDDGKKEKLDFFDLNSRYLSTNSTGNVTSLSIGRMHAAILATGVDEETKRDLLKSGKEISQADAEGRKRLSDILRDQIEMEDALLDDFVTAKVNAWLEWETEAQTGHGFTLATKDLCTLCPRRELNDEAVNFQILRITKMKNTTNAEPGVLLVPRVFNSHFFAKLQKTLKVTDKGPVNSDDLERLKRWYKNGLGCNGCKLIMFPVHLNEHWVLATLEPEENCACLYDSLHGEHDEHDRELDLLIQWHDEYCPAPKSRNWTKNHDKNIPRQTNSYDCGVYMLKYMERLYQGKKLNRESFTDEDITDLRQEIVRAFFSGPREVEVSPESS